MGLESMLGRVDEIRGHYVGTVFVSFMGPLAPTRSMYVVRETVSRYGNTTSIKYEGIDLPLQWSSVLLGYLRVWLGLVAFASPFALMWGQSVDFDVTRWEWQVFFALIALWLLIVFVPGRLRGEARKKVETLGKITGVFLDPRRFDEIQRAGRRSGLGGELSTRGIAIEDPSKVRDAAARASGDELATIYAFSAYSAVDRAEWKIVAEEAWQRLSRETR